MSRRSRRARRTCLTEQYSRRGVFHVTEYTLHEPTVRGATKDAPNRALSEDDFATDDLAGLDAETQTETINLLDDLGECIPNDNLGRDNR